MIDDEIEENETPRRKISPVKNILGMVLVAVVVLMIWTASSPLLTRPSLEKMIAVFNQELQRSQSARLTYESIEFKGFGAGKKAILVNPSLEADQPITLQKNSFSTSRIEISVDGSAPSTVIFTLPEPVIVKQDNKPTATIEFQGAPVYRIGRGQEMNLVYLAHELTMPGGFTIRPDASATESTPITVTFDAGTVFKGRSYPESENSDYNYDIKNIMFDAESSKLSIASLTATVQRSMLEDNKASVSYRMDVTDISGTEVHKALGPVSLTSDMVYTGPAQPASTGAPVVPVELKVNNLALSGKDFKVRMSGNITTIDTDPMPSGLLRVEIDNPEFLVESISANEGQHSTMLAALQKITGAPLEGQPSIAFDIKRESGSNYSIGKAPFEEIAMLMVAGAISQNQQLPASEDVAPAVEVPEVPVDAMPNEVPAEGAQ